MSKLKIWETKEQDLNIAKLILEQHYGDSLSEEIGLSEIALLHEGNIVFERPEWQIELQETFEAKYGEDKGFEVTQNVMQSLLLSGSTLH